MKRHARPHTCEHDNCGKSFRDRTDLRRHLRMAHEMAVEEIPCLVKECTRVFKGRKDNMFKHVRRNHPEHAYLTVVGRQKIKGTRVESVVDGV
jgi:uncharacterized C2H2 Zn-finger protein